ncbi:serine hydrolase domain-containing protein [Echinicola pacifica]|nr:serine hydrolase domain-containing protein [Echinicola pacifica]
MSNKKVKRIARIIFIIVSIGSLYFVPWILVKAWIMPLPATVQEQLEQAILYDFDGIIVYVDQAGKPPASYAAGWHNREDKVPADPQALFKIGSITKLYVAVAVAKLVNEGRLSLDASLADYLPELAGRIENSDKISLRMLVQHRTGIPNFTDVPNFWVDPPIDADEQLRLVLDQPADFAPDEEYRYSNTNYLLIGKILDKELGYNNYEYIKEEILIPLNLNHTFGSLDEVAIDELMGGYYVGIEEDIKTVDYGLNSYGSMLATAQDVAVFLRALNEGSLFKEGEQAIYTSIYASEHTGLIPGYQSIARYHKEMDAVIIQFNNTTNFTGYDWSLAEIIYSRIVKIVKKKSS